MNGATTTSATAPSFTTPGATPALDALITTAFALADRAVICDIETEATYVEAHGVRWYDLGPLVDDREHSPEFIDMASEGIAYAVARRLIELHPSKPHLARITRQL